MAALGLATRVSQAVVNIDTGRKGFAIEGKERQGRISYEDGISEAMSVFQEIQLSVDPYSIILVESAFITQEFQLCDKSDKDSLSSLTNAIADFDDAFLALEIVGNKTAYQYAEKTYPHHEKHRVKGGFPKRFISYCL